MKRKTSIVLLTLVMAAAAHAQTGNTLFGVDAGIAITFGDDNTIVGEGAGMSLTSGSRNVFLGRTAGQLFDNEDDVIAIGHAAGSSTLSGRRCIFIGTQAGMVNISPDNTFIGYLSGQNNTSGGDNVFIGFDSGSMNTTGSDNTFIGEEAGASNTTGEDNTFVGQDAGGGVLSGRRNTALGSAALSAAGASSGNGSATGYANTAIGFEAGFDISTGYNNTAVGLLAGFDLGEGFNNTFLGAHTGANTERADYNTMVGSHSGWDNNRAGGVNSGSRNTYLGMASGSYNRQGSDNVVIGAFADFSEWENVNPADVDAAFITDDSLDFSFPPGLGARSQNVSRVVTIGGYAHVRNNDGIAIGYLAKTSAARAITLGGTANSTHQGAITIGYGATSHAADTVVIGNAATLGWHPDTDAVTELGNAAFRFTNVTAQSYDAIADSASSADIELWADNGATNDDKWQISAADSGDLTISSFASGAYEAKLTIANSGDVTIPGEISINSDRRLKRDIQNIAGALELVGHLEGKTYYWRDELGRDDRLHYGLIAQQVESVIPELVDESSNGTKSVNYQALVPVLIESVKELRREKDAEIQRLRDRSAALESRLARIERLQSSHSEKDAEIAELRAEKDSEIKALTDRLATLEALVAKSARN